MLPTYAQIREREKTTASGIWGPRHSLMHLRGMALRGEIEWLVPIRNINGFVMRLKPWEQPPAARQRQRQRQGQGQGQGQGPRPRSEELYVEKWFETWRPSLEVKAPRMQLIDHGGVYGYVPLPPEPEPPIPRDLLAAVHTELLDSMFRDGARRVGGLLKCISWRDKKGDISRVSLTPKQY